MYFDARHPTAVSAHKLTFCLLLAFLVIRSPSLVALRPPSCAVSSGSPASSSFAQGSELSEEPRHKRLLQILSSTCRRCAFSWGSTDTCRTENSLPDAHLKKPPQSGPAALCESLSVARQMRGPSGSAHEETSRGVVRPTCKGDDRSVALRVGCEGLVV